ncbi:NAD(P)H-hydrate dehydratase [Aquimarina sp. U1-2]|uniref:NAD(P)H-hydrate dehydratase n=1 Tax=Aquimarina sp. U1-2 TaxID=2823141 RepID=UPI001AECBE1B|nr:NAD(P)H-hydrate dehydratase [Aquimarina sp. U1-2]MBP2833537.1 NAD(P)H-hydrate dehydratase [Aquimarina sp. U1-2]
MKILSAQQMRKADEATLKIEQISSLELMERAATKVFDTIHRRLQSAPVHIHVFCGIGNNGGDGLVISRLLEEHGYYVRTYIVNFSENRSKNFLSNYDRLKSMSKEWPTQLRSENDLPTLSQHDIVIDAMFGIGLNRPLVPWVKQLIKHINTFKSFVIAVDIPSGLYTDKAPDDPESILYCDSTITFQLPKLVFFLPNTGIYTRDIEVIDIGLDREFLQQSESVAQLIGKNEVLPLYRSRNTYTHKGTYGHCVLIGGSYGKIGSVLLCTKAALKIGTGLATAYIPECGYTTMQTAVPEAMVITDDDDELSEIHLDFEVSAIGIGIGMGTHEKTVKAFYKFLEKNTTPMVIDADGLNILAKNPGFLKELPPKTILTPHPKELERLIGEWKDDFDKLNKIKAFSTTYDCIIVAKEAHTITIYEDQLYINTTGNPGMATAGSGDVLTGIITGLLSQGYEPLHAAMFGVYIHGSAGDLAAYKQGFEATLASDIITNLGAAYLKLFEQSKK